MHDSEDVVQLPINPRAWQACTYCQNLCVPMQGMSIPIQQHLWHKLSL